HAAGVRIDLLYAISGDLKQVLAVEGRSCTCAADIDRAQRFPARGIEGDQRVSGSKPDMLTVVRDPMHVVDTREGSILADDLGGRSIHTSILADRQRSGEEQGRRDSRDGRGHPTTSSPAPPPLPPAS